MLNYSEIKDLDTKALRAKIEEKRREIFEFKMQKHTSGIEKSSDLVNAKKDLARLLTASNSK